MSTHLLEELRRHPAQVSIGGLLVGQVAKPAPVTSGDAVTVTLPVFNPSGPDNPNPTVPTFEIVAWRPHYTVAGDGTVTEVFPAAGDACLVAFDNNGQLWLLDWTATYAFPAGDQS